MAEKIQTQPIKSDAPKPETEPAKVDPFKAALKEVCDTGEKVCEDIIAESTKFSVVANARAHKAALYTLGKMLE